MGINIFRMPPRAFLRKVIWGHPPSRLNLEILQVTDCISARSSKKNRIFYIFIIFLYPQLISAKQYPPAYSYGSVVLNNYSRKAGVLPVIFDHWNHRTMFTCRLCHIDIGFAMQAESTRITSTSISPVS